tara:strand:- start:8237 stop:8935 length:699 start_codon:yes stop_codon:yes gene_type:complete
VFNYWDGTLFFMDQRVELQPAFYNTTTLANELATKITAVLGFSNVCVVVFDPLTRTFTVTITNGGSPTLFFFSDTCSFITRGDFMAPFPGSNIMGDPSDPLIGRAYWRSGAAGMLYTRYAIISSESFNQYSFSDSRATTLSLKNNIICIIDLTSIYEASDFDIGIPYSGVFATVSTPEAPHIMVTNPQRNLNERVDIAVQDEYGEEFDRIMELGGDYPKNTLGISLWLEVLF